MTEPQPMPVDLLYQQCVCCNGTGNWTLPDGPRECPACRPVRALPVGITVRQVDKLMRDKADLERRLDELPETIERSLLEGLSRSSVNCNGGSGCGLVRRCLADMPERTQTNDSGGASPEPRSGGE